jgi:bifunctional DNA-binding transcriptional regulator/antitoxin component of YhaV-PrlF toxin-antitoxin module
LGQVELDDKYRVVLDKKTRQVAGINKGDRLVAIPFKGGVILVAPGNRKFTAALTGFEFEEERHEASRFLFRRKT